jgi:hypothetical protein
VIRINLVGRALEDIKREAATERQRRYRANHPDLPARQRAWAAANPEKHRAQLDRANERRRDRKRTDPAYRAQLRRHKIFNRFRLRDEDVRKLVDTQGGVCAICGKDLALVKKPCIDHDHKTGVVRGVLCSPCNSAIGILGDDAEGLGRALAYMTGCAL